MKNMINFFYEIGSLRFVKRAFVQNVLQNTESLAEHLQRTTIIAYFMAKNVKADPYKTMLMAAFHDVPESRTGDSNWHQKEYITQNEEKAWQSQLKLIGKAGEEINILFKEYKARKTFESQLAKDADNIDYVLSIKELALTGNAEAKRRLKEDKYLVNLMYTDFGKKVMKEVLNSKPNEWYQEDRKKSSKKYIVGK